MTTEDEGDRFYRFTRAVLGAVYRLLIPVKVTGAEHLPKQGPVILAANHISFFDTIVLMFSVPRRTYFIGKAEYMDSWMTRRLFPALGLIPIERATARQAIAALGVAAGALGKGHALGIYPEGTRSRDGRLYKGRTGVAWLALTAGVPVVPVGLVGTDQVQPIGASFPRVARVRVAFGRPISPAPYAAMPAGRARRLLTDEVMAAIAGLSGQVRADTYNELPPEATGAAVGI